MSLIDILNQVAGGGPLADHHMDQIGRAVPADQLAQGLSDAFRSDQTPAIGQMVGQLFGNSSGAQQAGMLNQLIAAVGPAAAGALAGGLLGRVMSPGSAQLTPEQASQLSPQDVQAIVDHAHQTQPAVVDSLSNFYAQHSGLLKTLGSAALMIALAKFKNNMNRG